MGTFSLWHWIIVLLVVMLLFGAGKIPRLMGDVAKGVNAFKKGLKEDEGSDPPDPKSIDEAKSADGVSRSAANDKSANP